MNRFVEKVVHQAAGLGLERDVVRGSGYTSDATLPANRAIIDDEQVLANMYPQFGDDVTLLHLSEPCVLSSPKDDESRFPTSVRSSFTVCSPLVESIAANASAYFKGAINKMLPTYDTLASLSHEQGGGRVAPLKPSTVAVSGHKRFYPAHFSSYYACSYVVACISCAIDYSVWLALGGVFTLLAFGGLLSTCLILWLTALSVVAPKPVINAPQPVSPTPPPTEWVASYLYHMLSVGTFGSPQIQAISPGAVVSSTPHHFALVFQFISDNVRPTETVMIGMAIVLGTVIISACFNLACCYTLALAPNALQRQWRSNGNNSLSSVIALGTHQIIRRYIQHAANVRQRGVRMGRHALISMFVLKLTVNMFLEMDKQGMFPGSKSFGNSSPSLPSKPSDGSSAFPLDDIVTTAAGLNRVVGFITAFALAFVSADLLAGKLANRFLMRGRLPFFVKCTPPVEDEAKRAVAESEMQNEFKTHAAICPRLPDRLRFRGRELPCADGGASSPNLNEGRRMYYMAGIRDDLPASPESSLALDWLTELAPFVLSSDAVALSECFRKLFSVIISSLWMLLFWRWPQGWPFLSTFKSLPYAAVHTPTNGAAMWLVGLWTGHMTTVKGKLPFEGSAGVMSFSTTVIGLLLGVAVAILLYARRSTAPTRRVVVKRSKHTFDVATAGKNSGLTCPTLSKVLTHPASLRSFTEYVSLWTASQAAPFFKVMDFNAHPVVISPTADSSSSALAQTPTSALASANSRPVSAVASAYATDRIGMYATSVAKRPLGGFPVTNLLFMFLSLVIARHILLYPLIGLVMCAAVPKVNAPRLSQPDTSLYLMLVEANPFIAGAMLTVTLHTWYLVLTLLRDARDSVGDIWSTTAFTLGIVSRVAMLMGRTNTPLFRPLRHAYCDGVYDLCHGGHKRVIERASGCCDRLFVGTMCDEDCLGYKRRPIMSTAERAEEVARCQGVFRCLPASPPKGLPISLLAYYGITQVVYGEEYHKENDIYYASARELKIGITAPRTESISTSDLIRRVAASSK